jgi:hypothetical protein
LTAFCAYAVEASSEGENVSLHHEPVFDSLESVENSAKSVGEPAIINFGVWVLPLLKAFRPRGREEREHAAELDLPKSEGVL